MAQVAFSAATTARHLAGVNDGSIIDAGNLTQGSCVVVDRRAAAGDTA